MLTEAAVPDRYAHADAVTLMSRNNLSPTHWKNAVSAFDGFGREVCSVAGVAGFGPTAKLVNGDFFALDDDTGQLLWQHAVPCRVSSGPISYSVGARQYVAVAAGNTLFAFALRQ